MKRQIVSMFMALLMFLSIPITSVNANVQIQVNSVSVDEVYYVLGENIITGLPIIRPTMTISWEDPAEWAPYPPDPGYVHDPDYYDVRVINRTRNTSSSFRILKGTEEYTNKTVDVHEKVNLDAGSFYDIQVIPYHSHLNADGTSYTMATNIGAPKNAYAITDLNVEFVTTESSIQVIWDDLGYSEFEYNITYALGDYTSKSKQEFVNNKEGQVTGLTSDSPNVQRFYDPISRRNKLAYTLTERIYPGQVYSVMVEPMVDTYNAELVMRNRNFPVIRTCSTNVQLDIFEEGEYLRLEWEIPPSFRVGQAQEEYALVEATLMQYRAGQSSNIVIFDGQSASIGYYKIPIPSKETEYQIKFLYRAVANTSKPPIEPVSNIAAYVPTDLMIQPTKPFVPKLFSQEILDQLRSQGLSDAQIRDQLRANYFVPEYNYTGPINPIMTLNNTFHLLESSNSFNFIWSAFKRIDIDESSPSYGQPIFDNNVYYDIWVTDTLDSLAYSSKVVSDKRYQVTDANNIITDGTNIYGYSQVLNSYYNDQAGVLQNIAPGKLYYIKVVAKKKTAQGDILSDPSIVSVYYGYNGAAYEPPILSKPPLEVKSETATSVSINWEEDWWEVISIDPDADDSLLELDEWSHEVWVDENGKIFKEIPTDRTSTYFAIYKGQEEIDAFKAYLTARIDVALVNTIAAREIDLGENASGVSDVEYKFFRMPYAQVLEAIALGKASDPDYSFEDYYSALIAADKNGTAPISWRNISPTVDTDNPEKMLYTEAGLIPNTSYLFMVYPYRELSNGSVLYSHSPTPIVVSTAPEDVIVNPDPTVPNLYISDYTDTTMDLTWKYNGDFTYEIVYSSFEDVTTAKAVVWSLPSNVNDPLYPVTGEYYEVTVRNLFPNSQYYFWIRARNTATGNVSAWSNPAPEKTRDLAAPIAPRGFGIASIENMKKFNYDEAVTNEYITVEWILDENDVPPAANATVKKAYSYILEVANNPNFIDPVYIHSTGGTSDTKPQSVEILMKNLIKVNSLVPNRNYYLRVKTRVTITGPDQGQLIVKDSPVYSPTIKIVTSGTTNEYDGTVDPDLEILPTEDYEIIYNPNTKELEFRFRDNETDESGAKDNNVDQRLISNLIAQNQYEYQIDIAEYNNKTIDKRRITIPYSIIEAFDSYKVSLKINAGDIMLELPYGTITSEVKQQASLYGGVPKVSIEITEMGTNYVKEQMNSTGIRSVAEAQDMDIYVRSKNKEKALNNTDKEMNVNLLANNRYEQYRVKRMAAIKDYQNKWTTLSTNYDAETGYLSFKTAKIGTYGAYVAEDTVVSAVPGHWSEVYKNQVLSSYTLAGFNSYYPDSRPTEARIIQIAYGIATGASTINLEGNISNEMMNSLVKAKIKTNTSTTKSQISREEAINIFTRLYELKNEELIIPSEANLRIANNNANISSEYKSGFAKAATIGIITSIDQSRPKDALTYSELFILWSRIL